MNPFFTPNPDLNPKPDTWRNWVAGILVVTLIGTGIMHWGGDMTWKMFVRYIPFKITFLKQVVGEAARGVQGGDAVIVPLAPPPPQPEKITTSTLTTAFTARAIIAKDEASGMVLFAKNEYEARPLASLTKLASVLVLTDLQMDWTASTTAARDQVFDTFIMAGENYRLEDLWNAALVGSANRAVLSLVDASGLSREAFVARLNEKVRELGMTNTVLVEPTGLDEKNVSTASDMAILLREAMRQERIREALNLREYTIRTASSTFERHIWNTNWLLLRWIPHTLPDLRGGKTGYIPASGYNFSMQVANEADHVITVVVLGADSNDARFAEARTVAEWAFTHYRWP